MFNKISHALLNLVYTGATEMAFYEIFLYSSYIRVDE